jgi:hypothetical protein
VAGGRGVYGVRRRIRTRDLTIIYRKSITSLGNVPTMYSLWVYRTLIKCGDSSAFFFICRGLKVFFCINTKSKSH